MGTYVAAEARFRLMDLASDLRRHGRRFELTVEALADIRDYAEEKCRAVTQARSATLNSAPYSSYDPKYLYLCLQSARMEASAQGYLLGVLTGTSRYLEWLLRTVPTEGRMAEHRFRHLVDMTTEMRKEYIDDLCEVACSGQYLLRELSH